MPNLPIRGWFLSWRYDRLRKREPERWKRYLCYLQQWKTWSWKSNRCIKRCRDRVNIYLHSRRWSKSTCWCKRSSYNRPYRREHRLAVCIWQRCSCSSRWQRCSDSGCSWWWYIQSRTLKRIFPVRIKRDWKCRCSDSYVQTGNREDGFFQESISSLLQRKQVC